MKYIVGILFFNFILIFNLTGQNISVIHENYLHDYVALITQPISDSSVETGTCFFVCKNNDYYLVTAKHVAISLNKNASIIFNNNKTKLWLSISELADKIEFINHPTADIAILKLKKQFLFDTSERLKKISFPLSQIFNEKNIDRGLTLTMIGFPNINPIFDNQFTPIILTSQHNNGIIFINDFDLNLKQYCIIVDIPSINGLSGGPVLANVSMAGGYLSLPEGSCKGTCIMGIVTATKGDKTGGKIGYITPIFYIFDLLK